MSQKVVLAVATTAALVASTQACMPIYKGGKVVAFDEEGCIFPSWPTIRPHGPVIKQFDEESVDWHLKGEVGNGGRWGVGGGISGRFDEDEDQDQEQLQKLKKIDWKKVVHAVDTGLTLWGKAKNVFSEEDEKRGPTSWEINGGASNGGKWNIGGKISGSFDEEDLQKLQLDLRKANTILHTANKIGLFDEDNEFDQVQKLKLGKIVHGAVKVVKVAGAVGLLEEGSDEVLDTLTQVLELYKKAHKAGLFDEEEGNNYWEINGGASNGGNWNIGGKIGGTFDEEEEEEEDVQKINWGKVVKGVNTGLDLYGKGKKIGLFDEEEYNWNLGANIGNGGQWGINGGIGNTFANGNGRWGVGANVGNGGSWGVNAGLSLRFDEDEETPKDLVVGKPAVGKPWTTKHPRFQHFKPHGPHPPVKSHVTDPEPEHSRKPLLQRKKFQTKQ